VLDLLQRVLQVWYNSFILVLLQLCRALYAQLARKQNGRRNVARVLCTGNAQGNYQWVKCPGKKCPGERQIIQW